MSTQRIEASSTFRISKSFFFSSKESYLQIVNIADDDSHVHRLSGPCKLAFEALSEGASVQEIGLRLSKNFPELANPTETNAFLISFIKDLSQMGILEN